MSGRDCGMTGEMLSALLDEELRGSQRQWVAEHAASCGPGISYASPSIPVGIGNPDSITPRRRDIRG